MRERSVLPKTIEKYIDFLNGIKDNALPYECQVSIETIVTNNAINKSVVKPLEKIGLIKRHTKTSWDWIGGEPDKPMVLNLLDYVLHSQKPQQPAILPEYTTQIIDLLKEISSKLSNRQPTEEKALEGVKMSDRIYIAGQIASSIFKDSFDYNSDGDMQSIDRASLFIQKATDSLLKQLQSK